MAKSGEKLVYNGVLFKIYQWRQKMFDGSYEIFERLERPSLVQVIPIVKGKIATSIEKQPDRPGFYGVFGGRMEKGEKPLEAAKRELLEESGMTAKRWKHLRTFDYEGKTDYSLHLYAAIDCTVVAGQSLDAGEQIKTNIVTFKKFLGMLKMMRVGSDLKMYFMEIKYESKKRKKLLKELGIK